MTEKELPTNTLLRPFLDAQLAGRRGHDVRREDEGLVFPGRVTPAAGRAGDLTIGDRIPASGDPAGAVCVRVRRRA